jgi:hypothetical protein
VVAASGGGAHADKNEFIDAVEKNLKLGRHLILIVADVIRNDVEEIAKYLQQNAVLQFHLALVEMAFYRFKHGEEYPVYVQPRVVANTEMLERFVMTVNLPAGATMTIEEKSDEKGGRRIKLTEELFFEKFEKVKGKEQADFLRKLVNQLVDKGLHREWGSSSVSMRLPDPADSKRYFTVVVFWTDGTFQLGWLDRLEPAGYDPRLAREYLETVCKLTGAKRTQNKRTQIEDGTQPHQIEKLKEVEKEFLDAVEKFVDGIKSVPE